MKISRTLLVRFSQDECTQEEIQAIRAWLNEGSWPIVEGEEDVPDEIRQKVWNKLHERINPPRARVNIAKRWDRKIAGIAAGLLTIMGTLIFFHYKTQPGLGKEMTFTTGQNEHKKIILSDSSVAFLFPNTTIKLMQPFGKIKRDIQLTGQAVFEVAKDAARPFKVITGNLSTTALGTSFKITAFSDHQKIKVILSYGKIMVQDSSAYERMHRILLDPGEGIEYNKTTQTLEKAEEISQQFDYKNNILFFKNAGITEVVKKLELYYHVQVRYDELKQENWSVSGEFDYQPLDIVMQSIAYSCNIKYAIKGNKLMLKSNR